MPCFPPCTGRSGFCFGVTPRSAKSSLLDLALGSLSGLRGPFVVPGIESRLAVGKALLAHRPAFPTFSRLWPALDTSLFSKHICYPVSIFTVLSILQLISFWEVDWSCSRPAPSRQYLTMFRGSSHSSCMQNVWLQLLSPTSHPAV